MNNLSPSRRHLLQRVLIAAGGANLIIILGIWSVTSAQLTSSSFSGLLIGLGQLAGLIAAAAVLLQFLLMGRVRPIEQAFGLERLANVHRINGYIVLGMILAHPILLTFGYAAGMGVSPLAQYMSFLTSFEDVPKAVIAEFLFIAVVASSIYLVRKHLPYERWYWVHLMVYVATIFSFGHQVHVGGSFIGQGLAVAYWYALFGVVGASVAWWRFGEPAYNFWRFGFRVDRLVRETSDTVSVYIRGRGLGAWRARPGQFVIIWIPRPGFWLEQHPFSLSMVPSGKEIRLTIKAVGDYTRRLHDRLKPGDPIVVAGPYGTFTPEPSKRSRLYIAGGVGITPLRAMIEAESVGEQSVLVYGSRTHDDIIFADELKEFSSTRGLKVHHILSNVPGSGPAVGYVNIETIAHFVPDFLERDIYLCGPPVMMHGLTRALLAAGVPAARLHSERFALHPIS